jgi:hypothetical protein
LKHVFPKLGTIEISNAYIKIPNEVFIFIPLA